MIFRVRNRTRGLLLGTAYGNDISISVCVYIYIYVCVYHIYIYIHIHIHIHLHTYSGNAIPRNKSNDCCADGSKGEKHIEPRFLKT